MNFDPVEGLHYILDRYAFLNAIMGDGSYQERLTPESPKDEIAKAIKLARSMYHPDKQQRSGEKMRQTAEHMSWMIDDCERFLTDQEIKPLYDDKLASFKNDKPDMISTDGTPIINLSARVFDIDSLLSDSVKDTSAFETHVKALMRYDENKTAYMKSLFTSMPDNPQIKSLYRDALTQELIYVSFLEDAAWAKIGYINRKDKTDCDVIHPDEYGEKIEEALQNAAKRDIDVYVEQRGDSARIGLSRLPLLLTFNSTAEVKPEKPETALLDPEQLQEIVIKMKLRAHENFQLRAQYVRDVALRKQTALQELVTLTPVTAINNHNLNDPLYDFYLVKSADEPQVIMRLELDVSTGNANMAEVYQEPLTLDELKGKNLNRNSFTVERNPKITDILLEITAASNRVLHAMKDRFSQVQIPARPANPTP